MSIICKFCGASNPEENERCFSCDAPLPKRSDLSDKAKESLTNYIKSVEGMLLSSKDKANKKIGPTFIILAVIGIVSVIGFFVLLGNEYKKLASWLSVIWGFVLFLFFGFYVVKFENQSMSVAFKTKIRFEIKEYLNQMSFTEADFKTVASEVLDEKANLIKFLPEL